MPITSHGITIDFATSNFDAEVTNFTPPPWARESIPTTHAETADGKTFMPGDLPDYGELQFTIHFNEDDEPPIDGDAETITITFASGTTWEFTGFMTEYAAGGTSTEGDEKIEADVTVKVSGKITVTPAA
jgi:hypothetical protein